MANNNFNCPHCGKQIYAVPKPGQLAVKPQKTNRLNHLFENSVKSPLSPARRSMSQAVDIPLSVIGDKNVPVAGDWHRSTPIDRLNVHDIFTSLLDAGVVGSVCAVAGGSVLLAVDFDHFLIGTATCGFLGFSFRYLKMIDFAKSLTSMLEEFISDRLEVSVNPATEVPPLEVVHRNEKGTIQSIQRFNHLPQNVLDNLASFASQAGIKGLSVDTWTGSGKLFSKKEYTSLLDALAEAGIVEWNNPSAKAQGRRVTRAGARALAELAQMT